MILLCQSTVHTCWPLALVCHGGGTCRSCRGQVRLHRLEADEPNTQQWGCVGLCTSVVPVANMQRRLEMHPRGIWLTAGEALPWLTACPAASTLLSCKTLFAPVAYCVRCRTLNTFSLIHCRLRLAIVLPVGVGYHAAATSYGSLAAIVWRLRFTAGFCSTKSGGRRLYCSSLVAALFVLHVQCTCVPCVIACTTPRTQNTS